MKFVIQHSKTKREIEGTFSILGNQADLESLAKQILGHLAAKREEGARDGWYGWIDIVPTLPPAPPLTNMPPIGWDCQ